MRVVPLVGLSVMAVAGVAAGPYTPSWFDGTEPCTRDSAPCPIDVDPLLALRALSWATWGGLVVVLAGVALVTSLLARRDEHPTEASTGGGLRAARRRLTHVGVAGVVTLLAVTVGAWTTLMAGLGSSAQLALAAAAGTWLGLGGLLELVHRRLGRSRGGPTAYLLSLTVAALSCLTMWSVLVARETRGWWAGVAAAGLVAAAATGLGDRVAWDRWPAARTVGGVLAAAAAVTALAGGLSLLGLLHPPDRPTAGAGLTGTEAPPAEPPPRPTGPPSTSSPANPPPTTADPGVRTGRRCVTGDLRLRLTGFDAAMGARFASLEAVNTSGRPCYVDGFATVALSQGGSLLDVRSGTTSTSRPGMQGRATRVGLAAGEKARAVLYWRGFGAAADTTTPQTLTVALERGTRGQPVTIEPYAFDLADGGELRVGNWVLAE